MGDGVKQYHSNSDGCIYIFSTKTLKWGKFCDIPDPKDLPRDVRDQVIEDQVQAEQILKQEL
jgi:hypothetical protein